ncbi:hypothetical protein [Flectobacillus longus]|uniref:hypothetical protein n=1 Tax=Flectobacillus longus TaxID=2984207 RepID=UPI0024B82CFE|nr:hypothetical protein [Flectobacillus longus]MDI9879896.1 hypothetical protein [Flectobacillus longus]
MQLNQILSKEEERILLNGRINAIKPILISIPKWRRKLYAKNPIYQAKEFHVQNVLRNKSTNLELTDLLEQIVTEYLQEKEGQEDRNEDIRSRLNIKM